LTTRIAPRHEHTTAPNSVVWSKPRPGAFVPLARLERDLQPAVALTAPTGMLTSSHTSLPARVRDLAARVHTACHVSCLRLPCSCAQRSAARLRARPTPRVYRAGPSAPATEAERDGFGRTRKEDHQLADHGRAGLVWSCSALPRSRARRIARAGHMRDSTHHSADPFVACVGWEGG